MLSKAMLKRCQNELKQAFCALPEDVKKAIRDNYQYAEWLDGIQKWAKGHTFCANLIYRLSPDTPTDPEWEEKNVILHESTYCCSNAATLGYGNYMGDCRVVSVMPCHKRFLGIIYQKDGIETLRTSIDASFGTPVRVRFSKP